MQTPNIIASIATWLARRTTSVVPITGTGRSPIKSGSLSPDQALRVTIAGNCILHLAEMIASLDWTSDDEGVARRLQKPNPFQTKFDFWHSLTVDILRTGVGYVHRTAGDSLEYLAPFEPQEIHPVIDENSRPAYRVLPTEFGSMLPSSMMPNGIVPCERIIRIFDVPTTDGKGSCRLAICSESLRLVLDAYSMVRDLAVNGPLIGAFVTSPKKEGEGWAKRISATVQELFGSHAGSQRGGVMALDNGAMLHQFGPALTLPAELKRYVSGEELKICAAFSTPPFIAGLQDDSSSKYSNMSAQWAGYYRDAIFPLIDRLSQAFTLAYGLPVYPDLTRLLAGDLPSAVRAAVEAYAGGVWTRAEARRLTAQPVADDGSDDVYVDNPQLSRREDEGLDSERPRGGQDTEDTDDGNLADIPEAA